MDVIHAEQTDAVREAAIDNFRAGRTWLLIATDLVGRGMDFLGVTTVVNYDFPTSTHDYVHRVGRTGRAGRQGKFPLLGRPCMLPFLICCLTCCL